MSCFSLATAQAGPTLIVGDHYLERDKAHQPIPIYISGAGTNLQGVWLNVQIGDGGPLLGGLAEVPFYGNITPPPVFDGNDYETLLAGTIFQNNNTGVVNVNQGVFGNQVIWLSTTTAAGFVDGNGEYQNGLLATLYVDTRPLKGGPYENAPYVFPIVVSAGGYGEFPENLNGPTEVVGTSGVVPLDIQDGRIIFLFTPEPSSFILGGLGMVSFSVVARSRLRRVSTRERASVK